jgi:hypothetical protein
MVVITIPNNKPPNDEVGAVEFCKILQESLFSELTPSGQERGFRFLWNDNHTEIVNVETAEGRNTEYVRNFLKQFKEHKLHLDIRSYDVEDDLLKPYDAVISYFEGLSNTSLIDSLVNVLSEVCVVDKIEAEYSTHRLSLVSETLFDTPSIIIYLNEGAIDLYSAIAEELVKFLLERPVVRKID